MTTTDTDLWSVKRTTIARRRSRAICVGSAADGCWCCAMGMMDEMDDGMFWTNAGGGGGEEEGEEEEEHSRNNILTKKSGGMKNEMTTTTTSTSSSSSPPSFY
ncbi:hypothetical protein niasHS_006034 [Heterodera schachtii]|uniref:Uncharacterized protein n=1 Tax=Heterodera schachtii TaxID=97005 RepID=A0ABD2JVV2_HETSC